METSPLGLEGLFVVEPECSSDDHGRYSYYYSEKAFAAAGAASHFVQEHASHYPLRHTVRGPHFRQPPHAQTKVVRVARGRIWDVCVAPHGLQQPRPRGQPALERPGAGHRLAVGDQPAWVFAVDRQWPALAALDSPFHHQETNP